MAIILKCGVYSQHIAVLYKHLHLNFDLSFIDNKMLLKQSNNNVIALTSLVIEMIV